MVLTSATLAIAGDFGFIRERLGLGGRTEELALASPFDYLSQALCILVTDIPPYDAPEYEQALASISADVARRLGGRTLGLFTGYGALRRIRDLAGRRLAGSQISVLGQGFDGTRRQLLTSFVENPRTLLLGTGTFWEGIDVPGDALQCVIIAKLPFAVPTDPLVRARTAELRDPFGSYVLPEAVIRLRQGFGRLIRSGTDRGVVVIADSASRAATTRGASWRRCRRPRWRASRSREWAPGSPISLTARGWRRIHPMVTTPTAAGHRRPRIHRRAGRGMVPPPHPDRAAQMAPRLGDLPPTWPATWSCSARPPAGAPTSSSSPSSRSPGTSSRTWSPRPPCASTVPSWARSPRPRGVSTPWWAASWRATTTASTTPPSTSPAGAVVHVHRKVYLPTYGLFDEARDLAAGDRFRAFEAPLRSAAPPRPGERDPHLRGPLAPELRLPARPRRRRPDHLPVGLTGPRRGHGSEIGTAQSYDVITRTYAQLFTAYVAYCNRVGYEDGINFWGGSRVVDPEGRLVGEPAGRDEAMPLHRLDLAALRRARIANPCSVTSATTSSTPSATGSTAANVTEPSAGAAGATRRGRPRRRRPLVTEILTGFVREEVRKVGFERGVVGLSGGIDSALTLALVCRALGPENAIPVIMPYRASSPASERDARLVAAQLGPRRW